MTMTWLDPIGAGFALIATYFFTKASPQAWPLALIATIINSVLYWQKGIYGHFGLELIYLASTVYGWLIWVQKKHTKPDRAIKSMPWQGYVLLLLVWPASVLFAKFLYTLFQSDVASIDAVTTLLALTAQFMLCRKWIECWIVWFIVDALVAGLQFYKGIPFHSATHALYLGFAVLGYIRWAKFAHQKNQEYSKVELQTT